MAVVEVLKDLLNGLEQSTQAYIEGAKDLKVWTAFRRVICLALCLSYSMKDCRD